jgi:outer membrane protein assembly factor BamB
MRKIIVLIAVVLISVIAFGQENGKSNLVGQVSEKTNVRFEKIWEKRLNEEVNYVILDEEEITVEEAKQKGIKGLDSKQPKEKIKIPYHKVVVTETELKFYDMQGNVKKKYSLVKEKGKGALQVRISKNEKYIVIIDEITPEDYDYRSGRGWEIKFTVLNLEGQELWKVQDKLNYSDCTVSNDGKYIIVFPYSDCDEAPLFVISQSNRKEIINLPFPELPANICFSHDGKYIAVAGGRKYQYPDISTPIGKDFLNHMGERYRALAGKVFGNPALVLFDSQWNELWRRELDISGGISPLLMSEDNRLIAFEAIPFHPNNFEYSYTENLYMFDFRGNLLWKKTIPRKGYVKKFFQDNNLLLLACENIGEGHIYVFNTKDGKLLWEYGLEEHKGQIDNVVITNDSNYILVRQHITGERPTKEILRTDPVVYMHESFIVKFIYYLFKKDGTLIWKREEFTPEHPVLEFFSPVLPKRWPFEAMRTLSDGKNVIIQEKDGYIVNTFEEVK